MEPVNIGLLGLGTVGCGTVNVLQRNYEEIIGRTGRDIQVTQVAVNNLEKERDCNTSNFQLGNDPFAIVNDPSIDVIVELIGGEDLAKELILTAIQQKKHVITANKALIAKHGNEIFAAASEHGVMVAFEAAVAGGIPIIKAVRESLAGNRIQSVAGIINGTSNFILSSMQNEGSEFSDVLEVAQKEGYAEADPTLDINGVDIAHKLTILASIAFGIPLQFDKVYVEGIEEITLLDIQLARELGYTIKQLGFAKRREDGIELRVHPTLIPRQVTLAHVNGVMNALAIVGDAVGPTLFNGAGAGAEPTASSVIADLVDVVRTLTSDPNHRVPHLAFQPSALQSLPVLDMDDTETGYYLYLMAVDKAGVLAEVTHVLGELSISIESILQREGSKEDGTVPIVIMTHRVVEKNMQAAIEKLQNLESIRGPIKSIRMEHIE